MTMRSRTMLGTMAAAMVAICLIASNCGTDPNPQPVPSTTYTVPVEEGAPESYTLDDLSAEFLAWAADEIESDAAEAYASTIVAQINDTPDEAACFITDEPSVECMQDDWQQSLIEWGADCNPPRNAANVTCPDPEVQATPAQTPTAALEAASDKIEQAHEGIGNIIHHDDGNWDNNGCGVKCGAALGDAIEKTTEACDALGPDITGLYTWDHNQTVGHACTAALYWLANTAPVDDATHHAEYQLGILRDVLRAQVKARQVTAPAPQPTANADIAKAHALVEAAHEGIGNIIHHNTTDCPLNPCGDAITDAIDKLQQADALTPQWLRNKHTWDHNQNVEHAYAAAIWHLDQAFAKVDDVDPSQYHEAEFQIGILRDVLSANMSGSATLVTGLQGTSQENIKAAHDLVEQAHKGIGNVLKNNLETDRGCATPCEEAIDDAWAKTQQAHGKLGSDILSLRTWDNNQTVQHAFYAANYWLHNTYEYEDPSDAHHAEYQLGILRDVLAAHSNQS